MSEKADRETFAEELFCGINRLPFYAMPLYTIMKLAEMKGIRKLHLVRNDIHRLFNVNTIDANEVMEKVIEPMLNVISTSDLEVQCSFLRKEDLGPEKGKGIYGFCFEFYSRNAGAQDYYFKTLKHFQVTDEKESLYDLLNREGVFQGEEEGHYRDGYE